MPSATRLGREKSGAIVLEEPELEESAKLLLARPPRTKKQVVMIRKRLKRAGIKLVKIKTSKWLRDTDSVIISHNIKAYIGGNHWIFVYKWHEFR